MFSKMAVWVAPSFPVVTSSSTSPAILSGEKNVWVRKILLPFISVSRQTSHPGTYPWDIVQAGCLCGPCVSPPKCQCKGIHRHDNEPCASPERGVKRGNFWNDGCRRWCPICFSSLEFTASAALCKQLGSKTGFFFFLMLGRQCPSENIILDFSGEILNHSGCMGYCLDGNIAVFTCASIISDRAGLLC